MNEHGQEFLEFDIIAASEKVVGKGKVLKPLVYGRLRYSDGYRICWTEMGATFDLNMVAAEHGVELPPNAPAEVFNQEKIILARVPDYPADDAVTLVFLLDDAEKFARSIIEHVAEARKAMTPREKALRDLQRRTAQKEVRQAAFNATRCSETGCNRDRHFFDENGNGYCKRHSEERGIRPTGAV